MPLINVPDPAEFYKDPSDPYDPDGTLQSTLYTSTATYDAIGRVSQGVDPAGNIHEPEYNETGRLESMVINSIPYINNLLYNAKGQKIQADYCKNEDGDKVCTTYNTYDPRSYRMEQIYTTLGTVTRTNEYEIITEEDDDTRQNLIYTFDPVGNVMELDGNYMGPMSGETTNTVFPNSGTYTYDAFYQLTEATGYEAAEDGESGVGEL